MTHVLDPLNFPLRGGRLIEASAGTGKTWTIATLYVRLVLGHGSAGTAFRRALLPAEILVMTFTRAATRELSERIRTRLLEAARCFRGDATPAADDLFLRELLAEYADPSARQKAAWQLAMAAEAMDDAAIFTIDAWCQRMLREHAFDSGNPFDEELAADESALLATAVQDFWRQQCYPLDDGDLGFVLACWSDVDALIADMRELVGQPLPAAAPDASLAACVQRVRKHNEAALIALAKDWDKHAQEMKKWMDQELAQHAGDWNRSKLNSKTWPVWLDKLADWARAPHRQALDLTPTARRRLTPEGMQDARKANAPELTLPAEFAAFERLLARYDALPSLNGALRIHAATQVGERFAQMKREARSFGFADQLERLDAALSGAHRTRLRSRIRTQYPVALIDEFQDTSPLQYRLFHALYDTEADDGDTALLLIGDPKQSIYGFRGADIYSYLRARHATRGRHYALGTNYRSTAALVSAVNQWFEQAESDPKHDGAFLFRSQQGNKLPFEAVQAKGRAEVLRDAKGAVPALTIAHDLTLTSSGTSRRLFAARCAERIVSWLNDEAAGFDHPESGFTRLRPADIAVLVRTGKEADAVRGELRRRGVASVYLSDKDSVFASIEAQDLLRWLRAVAAPLDARLVRAALATRIVGLPLGELGHLAHDDEAFDARSEQMRSLHTVWREQGVLAMLRRSLHLFDLPAQWLRTPDGERRLTNFLHLAELLQQASAELDGEQALIRWLATQIDQPASGQDEQVVRLESDADLVKVVTVHKSKGLEYPLVCLPFACSFRAVERRYTRALKLPDDNDERALLLDFGDDDLADADHERLREDLRLFYVALTRARHALWMGFATLNRNNGKSCVTHESAPGYLLGGTQEREDHEWRAPLTELAKRAQSSSTTPGIVLEAAATDIACTALQARGTAAAVDAGQSYAVRFERNWALGSFTALVRAIDRSAALVTAFADVDVGNGDDGNGDAADTELAKLDATADEAVAAFAAEAPDALSPTQAYRPAADEAEAGDELTDSTSLAPAATTAALPPWHRFPRGSFAGDFVHTQLEWLAGENFALAGNDALQDALRQRCARAGRAAWAEETVHWMLELLAMPLPSTGAALPELRTQLSEMEFWMPAAHVDASAIDRLCHQYLLGGAKRPALPPRALHGMLMGFADLVFEHEGRYWVLDYKSNTLGANGTAYDDAALQAAMAQHRYDVQAALYLLALHRLLRARLGDAYDPARQLGGALYFFVRGIDGPMRGEYAIPADPNVLKLLEELDQLFTDEDVLA